MSTEGKVSDAYADMLFNLRPDDFHEVTTYLGGSWSTKDLWKPPLYTHALIDYENEGTESSYSHWSSPKYFSDVSFFSFFNKTESYQDMIDQGKERFLSRIMISSVSDILEEKTRDKTALEIGFGSGRLMIHACKHFKAVTGIDIHGSFEKVRNILSQEGLENYSLIKPKSSRCINDSSIDFVYSFVVFQHFDSISSIIEYLLLIKRVLKKNGCAILYFGINNYAPQISCVTYKNIVPGGVSLVVNPVFAILLCEEYGIEVVSANSHPDDDDQFYIVFLR